jgi:FSR family fosmidomycin resistance protein-like MFS transporter
VVLGKALGGVLADRHGFAPVAVGALLASLPLLVLAPSSPAAGILGMLVFNMTMPVTLAVMANVLPERPGFAFGLTCTALVAGGLPPLLRLSSPLSALSLGVCVTVSAILLLAALSPRTTGYDVAPRPLAKQEA